MTNHVSYSGVVFSQWNSFIRLNLIVWSGDGDRDPFMRRLVGLFLRCDRCSCCCSSSIGSLIGHNGFCGLFLFPGPCIGHFHFEAVVLNPVRPAGPHAGHDRPESPAERLREERVQNRVDAGVAVSQDVRNDLYGHVGRRGGVHVQRPEDQYNVYGEPREREDDHHDQDHFDHTLLVLDALGAGSTAGGLKGKSSFVIQRVNGKCTHV